MGRLPSILPPIGKRKRERKREKKKEKERKRKRETKKKVLLPLSQLLHGARS